MIKNKIGFTLAETLIALAIIGVVAALTLPTLITKINDITSKNQQKVIEAKLIKSLNLMDSNGGINDTYNSTAEFANAWGKYLKISKVCDGTTAKFSDCLPYDDISYTDLDGKIKSINVDALQTLDKIGLLAPFMKPVAFVLADGTPIIISYKKDCLYDPDSVKIENTSIHPCVSGLYDSNKSHKPNVLGKDLIGFNGAHVGVFSKIGGHYILAPIAKSSLKKCADYIDEFDEITHCPYTNDGWVGALVACKEMGGHLPSLSELADIANEMYPNGFSSGWKPELVKKLGVDPSTTTEFTISASSECSPTNGGASARTFKNTKTYAITSFYDNRYYRNNFICIAN